MTHPNRDPEGEVLMSLHELEKHRTRDGVEPRLLVGDSDVLACGALYHFELTEDLAGLEQAECRLPAVLVHDGQLDQSPFEGVDAIGTISGAEQDLRAL